MIADTGPLYAAADPSDRYHAQAQAELLRLEQENRGVLVLYPIALETYTRVSQRLGIYQSLSFIQELTEGADLLNPSDDDYQAAFQRVLHYPDQKITLFDAVTAIVTERLRLSVWTYDYHFDVMRTPVWR